VALLKLINEYRAENGVGQLLMSDALSEAADRHDSDMANYDFFDHYTQGSDWFALGASPWDRMAASGYDYNTYKGENIAGGFTSAEAVLEGWKNSPSHDANMLKPQYQVVGISLVVVEGSTYGYYWTTDFGGYIDPTAHEVYDAEPNTSAPTWGPGTSTAIGIGLTPDFSDVGESTDYATAIRRLAARGIVSGYPDGTFRPDNLISRQQIAKMLALTMGYQVSLFTTCDFIDVDSSMDPDDSLYPQAYIAACAARGAIVGKTPLLFAPYDPVTRAQIITIVARAAQLAEPTPGFLPPFPVFSVAHYPWAARAAEAGLLDGLLGMGRNYDFWAGATRGEVCQVLSGLLH